MTTSHHLHIDADEALQPSISCLCYRRRKFTKHISTFKLLRKYTLSAALPADWHVTPVFTSQHATTSRPSSNHHRLTARVSAASSPASASFAISRCQTAAAVEPLPLPPIGPFQDHCCKQFKAKIPKRKHYTAPHKTL